MPNFARLASKLFLCAIAITASLTPSRVFADASSASLAVAVTDPSGAVIRDASVDLRNTETNQVQHSVSSASGNAVFPFLKPGHYSLLIAKTGFADLTVADITLNVGDNKQLHLAMKVGSAAQQVTVNGSGLTINTTDASVSTVVDRNFVANMPLNGRSFQDLISMTPGVVTTSPQVANQSPGLNGGFSINGQRTDTNYYTVDGVSANTNSGTGRGGPEPAQGGAIAAGTALGTTQTLLSVDSLQEFRVESSTYSAEFGRGPGGQVSFVSRGGTNVLHGTASEYFRNGWFDANDWFNDELGQPKEELHQNDFGGTLGGPVWIPRLYNGTDKTFFFVSYEGLRLDEPVAASTEYVPDEYMRQQATPVLQPFLNAFPKQSSNGIDYGTAQSPNLAEFFEGYSVPGSINSTSVRLDHTFSPRLTSFFRFSDTPSSINSRPSGISQTETDTVTSQTYTLGTTFQVLNDLTNELRLGYTTGTTTVHIGLDDFGAAVPFSMATAMNLTPASPNNSPEIDLIFAGVGNATLSTGGTSGDTEQWNLTDGTTLQIHKHQIRFGLDYRRLRSGRNPEPVYGDVGYESMPSLTQNAADYAYAVRYLNGVSIYNQLALYGQDQWKISPALTLSYGLRWEVDPPPHSGNENKPYIVLGDLTNPDSLTPSAPGAPLWHTPWLNFAPRIGAAWQVHRTPGHETVLRAGGGVFFDTDNEAANYAFATAGYEAVGFYSGVPMPFTAAQQNLAIDSPPYFEAMYYPRHLQLPYTNEWNVALEQSLSSTQTFTLSYVASSGRRLIQSQELYPSSSTFESILYIPGAGVTSNYQGLQAKFQRQVSTGVNALVSYTWSHSLDYGSNYASLPLTYGNSDFDVRNNLQAALTWSLPSVNAPNLAAHIINGWGVDSHFMARTGFPITLEGNYTTDLATGSGYYTNVNVVSGIPLYLYGSEYPGGRILNRAAFTLPTGSEQGTAARNFVRGFGAEQWNVAVRRAFPVNERVSFQFRAEAFNVLNHPNFGYVWPYLSYANFGYATQMLNESLGTVASQYQQGGPRSMQFALKLLF
ncbi:TonB-dependent receptor [Edaphobacter dinghuensis]|uniref:TonB-dependent transporter Oar-like beta-barrel domain-containing protein n=1 Tax=Edaphobacter dinghuensis TaxID=1560005 RepID=A0A917HQG2_9BACT|nr:TonB-dependent receptor [Edaphobacter dinghuensis]GGG86444.1 hypothetical protein GCM10011585_32970 [Edaphobacter dinghuensis]